MSDSTDTNPVSAVPSGSAGEPTPTPDVRLPPDEVMREMIDAVLAFDPGEVPEAVAVEWCTEVAMRTPAFQGWLSAVAAAATAQTADRIAAQTRLTVLVDVQRHYNRSGGGAEYLFLTWLREAVAKAAAESGQVRALAGGAPPATQTTDTTEE
jgi:hypothetical protein